MQEADDDDNEDGNDDGNDDGDDDDDDLRTILTMSSRGRRL